MSIIEKKQHKDALTLFRLSRLWYHVMKKIIAYVFDLVSRQ
jgi:hypothetical protein